mmetsp:Transcript_15258/g.39325  ORF Transcript_15258/g.39325 Transcript_15258/m.39325 type:complete len:209 (-) Transcript_15258:287-913(-)
MSSLAVFPPPATPVVQDFSVLSLAGAPWQAAGLLSFLFASQFLSTVLLSAASQWCTAAESAIVSTSAGMGFGYAAQTELYGASPDRLALAGAALMMVGVTVMAVANVQPPKPAEADSDKAPLLVVAETKADKAMTAIASTGLLPLVAEDSVLDVSGLEVGSGLAALVPEDKMKDFVNRPAASDASTADPNDLGEDDEDETLLVAEEMV